MQAVAGDLSNQSENFYNFLSWRDPRATALFLIFYLVASIVLYVIPFEVVVSVMGFYTMRHPKFREKLPSVPFSFFRRLPAQTDSLFSALRCLTTLEQNTIRSNIVYTNCMTSGNAFFKVQKTRAYLKLFQVKFKRKTDGK
ncbi:hypothetical protein P3S68_011367 [Capsicum galapagoense]